MGFTTAQILTLAKAGFTATQIAALNNVGGVVTETNNPQNPQTQLQLEQTPAPAAATAQQSPIMEQLSAPAAEPQGSSTDEILKAINGLSSTFQQTMLRTAVQPQPKTAEDILAEIINPPAKAQGGKQ